MSININGEKFTTFSDYLNDKSKVSEAERAQIEFETALIGKVIEAREAKGLPPAVRHGERGCAEQKRSAKPAHKTGIIHIMK